MSNSLFEIEVNDTTITIWHKFSVMLKLMVGEDGRIHLCVPNVEAMETHESYNPPRPIHPRKIEVNSLVKKKEAYVALPRLVSARLEDGEVFRPETIKRATSSGGGGGPLINENEANIVLNAVCDSFLAKPNQTKDEIAAESHRIANDLNIRVGSVAAVRANFTRGTYGDPDTIIATRAAYLRRHAPLREGNLA